MRKTRINARWQTKRGFFARAAGRLSERKDEPAPPLVAPDFDRRDHSEESPPIFVVGCQRSGTSLLRRILDSHSRIACPPESQFILPLVEILQGKGASIETKYLSGLASMGYSRSEVESSLARFISAFFERYASSQGKVRWADKSPLYVDCLPELRDIFGPRARFILLVRHGLDVAFSLSDAHRDYPAIRRHVADAGGNVAIGAGRFWAEQNAKIHAFRAASPDLCFQIRYEELTTDPRGALEPLFAFLKEPWEPDVIDYGRFSHHHGFEDSEVRRRSRIEPNSGRYLAWPEHVQTAVREACEPMLSKLGYR
jgi:hypothetical protein